MTNWRTIIGLHPRHCDHFSGHLRRCRHSGRDAGPTLLLEAARAAHRGDVLASPSITVRLLAHSSAATPSSEHVQLAAPLTNREEEVLRAAARGRRNTEIAKKLFILLGTVKTHLSSLQDKIGAESSWRPSRGKADACVRFRAASLRRMQSGRTIDGWNERPFLLMLGTITHKGHTPRSV